MPDRKKLYEGKAKVIFDGPKPNTYIQYFKDDATAFNGKKKGTIGNKGVLNNLITAHLMEYLAENGILTHFIKKLNNREQLIKQVDIFPVEFVVRNVAAGSLCDRLGIERGTSLVKRDAALVNLPLIEFYYKDDDLNDPLICETHIIFMELMTRYQIDYMKGELQIVNKLLTEKFAEIGVTLVDYKLEYGIALDETDGLRKIVLADEISPDTCRLWDSKTKKVLDKDRFRNSMGEVEDAYTEIAKRLGVI